MKKVFITTLGCKVNQFESASIKTAFEEHGISPESRIEEADVVVINTCAVTGKASAQSRQAIRSAARKNESASIVVTGCHAQFAADEIRDMTDISTERLSIVGNDRKDILVSEILGNKKVDIVTEDLRKSPKEICQLPVSRFGNRTRAFLRVQDGCNSFCSYCIVPYTRGPSRSLQKREILAQARQYQAAGHREIVVTGIHVGQYGRDLAASGDISDLMELLCNDLPDVRFRLSSIEPLEIDSKLLKVIKNFENFMPHLHIPLQSGDNDILGRMNRRYNREQFSSILSKCRSLLPDAAIGIDVLVGFPGESPKHFDNTRSLLELLDFTYLHVFPYSRRPGTPAADFTDQIDKKEKSKRVETLRILSEKNRIAFYTRHTGTRRKVLIEHAKNREGQLKGFTDNYIPVLVDGEDDMKNNIVLVELGEIRDGSAIAYPVSTL